MRVDVVSSEAEFLSLRGPWEALAVDCAGSSVFHAWSTVYHAWKIDAVVEPHVLVAREGEQVVGILPLGAKSRRNGPFTWRALQTIGPKRLDFVDAIVAPERLHEVLTAFAERLAGDWWSWDDLHLSPVREDAGLLALVKIALPKRLRLSIERVGENLALALPEGAESWEDAVGGETRRTTRRILKRIDANGFVTAGVADGYPLSTAVDAFVELHVRRRSEFGETSRFLDVDRVKLCAMVAEVVDDGGDLLMMEREGVPVATQLTLRAGTNVSHYRLAFDSEYRSFSPGIALLARAVDAAVKSGAREYDFGFGTEEYKRRWSNLSRSIFGLRLVNTHPARTGRRLWSLVETRARRLRRR